MLAVTDVVVSAVAVALMVTVPPGGTVAGAVKVVFAPLAVCAGLNAPQLALPQVTVQSTPAFVESFETVALICAVELTASDAGGAVVKAMLMGGVVVMVTLAVTNLVLFAVDAALIVTVFPVG